MTEPRHLAPPSMADDWRIPIEDAPAENFYFLLGVLLAANLCVLIALGLWVLSW